MLWRILGIVALGYAAIVALAWLFQHRLLYLPSVGGTDWAATPAAANMDWEDVRITTDDGVELSAWWVPARPRRGALLFFHGNAGNISHRIESIQIFHRLGLSVLIMDYRGYGQSGGRPSESGTYLDAEAAWRHLVQSHGLAPRDIVVFGRSLGAAIAAHLARELEAGPAALILESAFTSAPDMAQEAYPILPARWLARFRYATREYVQEVKTPVLVIHSEDDEIVPFHHGKAVFDAAPEPKQLLALEGGHNTGFMESARRYSRGLDEFLTQAAGMPPVESRE